MRFGGARRLFVGSLLTLLAAHAILSIVLSAGLYYRRIKFARWWTRASVGTREEYLYSPDRCELIRWCLRSIDPTERVLVRTDGEPWLINYYLYPRRLFQETTSPSASDAIGPPSRRQARFPRLSDAKADWIIEDFYGGSGGARRQRVFRPGSETLPPP